MKRVRLDDELISQGICADRADALRILMAGEISSRGERLTSPGMKVEPGISLHVRGRLPYVGRGGIKLEGALDSFGLNPSGADCVDIGCSTGGFTDCLLKRGAASVVAVDVGRAQFAWSLRNESRVTLLERTNVVDLPELGYRSCCDLAVCDVSFTSIGCIIHAVRTILKPRGTFLALVKPQFEAAQDEVDKGGVVRDPAVRRRVLQAMTDVFINEGFTVRGISVSPITGAKGNIEFFMLGNLDSPCANDADGGARAEVPIGLPPALTSEELLARIREVTGA